MFSKLSLATKNSLPVNEALFINLIATEWVNFYLITQGMVAQQQWIFDAEFNIE